MKRLLFPGVAVIMFSLGIFAYPTSVAVVVFWIGLAAAIVLICFELFFGKTANDRPQK